MTGLQALIGLLIVLGAIWLGEVAQPFWYRTGYNTARRFADWALDRLGFPEDPDGF